MKAFVENCLNCGKFYDPSSFPLCSKCDREFKEWLRWNQRYIDTKRRGIEKSPIDIWIDEMRAKKKEKKK